LRGGLACVYYTGNQRPKTIAAMPAGQDAMNAHLEMTSDEVLRVKLAVLKREHRDLDDAIHAMDATGRADQLALRRLKKRKLALKDEIARIEDLLTPDIIA
jgi:hypothetical protein